jgi:mRNA interferase HicA
MTLLLNNSGSNPRFQGGFTSFSPTFERRIVPDSHEMESATFRKWLADRGCRFDRQEQRRHEGPVTVTVHREGKKSEVPLGGPQQALDPRIVRRACEELGLDWTQLPGPASRV